MIVFSEKTFRFALKDENRDLGVKIQYEPDRALKNRVPERGEENG